MNSPFFVSKTIFRRIHLTTQQHGRQTLYGKKLTFKLPSGYEVTIREQNGEDDDILSNPVDAKTFMNISKFIAGIVTDTDITATRLLTPEDVQKMPSLDRYAIW